MSLRAYSHKKTVKLPRKNIVPMIPVTDNHFGPSKTFGVGSIKLEM